MKRFLQPLLLPVLMFVFTCLASRLEAQELDAISREASQLEAQLGKYNDNAAEAADVMVKLVDLYHSDARVFGLVRISDRFVSTHPSDKRHHDVMLKLIDGLQAMSRNKNIVVACRQFLNRYPKSKHCAAVEVTLANTLDRGDDKKAAAAAFHAIWNRQKNSAAGRQNAVRAITRYTSMGNDQVALGAKLAEEVLGSSEGVFAVQVGMKSLQSYMRIGNWSDSNRVAATLIKKNVIRDKEVLRQLHLDVAENYNRLGQHANSAASLESARKIRDDQLTHYKLIEQLDRGKAGSREISPIVKAYALKYTDREDRFRGYNALVQAYIREDKPDAATTLIGKVLAFDAMTNDNARVFVEKMGSEPKQLAESERVLREALGKNEKHGTYIRYVLAFTLHRDRMKDLDKMNAVLHELLTKSPSDEYYTRSAVETLLNAPKDDAEFDREVKRILKARRDNLHVTAFDKAMEEWRSRARRDSKRKGRASRLQELLADANKDEIQGLAAQQTFRPSKQDAQVREKLLSDRLFGKLSPAFADRLLESQAYYYRHNSGRQRADAAPLYGKLALRQPDNFERARLWLESATDYAAPEICKESAEHLLKMPPQETRSDVWRRLMIAAEKNRDKTLAKKAFDWIIASQRKFGLSADYAAFIGDMMKRLELTDDARKIWKVYLTFDRNHQDSRDCAWRLMEGMEESEKLTLLTDMLSQPTPFQGRYATWLADLHLTGKRYDQFVEVVNTSKRLQEQRPLETWDLDIWKVNDWINRLRQDTEMNEDDRRKVLTCVKNMRYAAPSSAAALTLMELGGQPEQSKIDRVLRLQEATVMIDSDWNAWDGVFPYAQSALSRKDYLAAATVASGLLSNVKTDEGRQKKARDIITQSYARMGSVGLTIDEDSPIAPLLQAALYLRLGDETLAYAAYDDNRALFDENRDSLPVDLVSFVCAQRIAAGGDENHEYVEGVLRGWLVANSESKQIDEDSKAQIQLLLAKNYYKSRRFDVARSEFTTTINRYPGTKQATEARFGIGESFMSQKVFDQAELVFEELARSPEMEIVVRAEFLRGVLAFRRGDRDDARDIFRSVLERVPDVSLANQALYNLSEVYGSEERYIDQLNLLRTVGRLGRKSKRLHAPGLPLSIVVHDSDLGISRGHNKIPVIVTTKPSGDSERIMLTSTGAGRGLFRADLTTRLGAAEPGDKILQVVGGDTIQCDYPDEFKNEFKKVPLSDVEITIAATAEFEAASSKILDEEEETFSQRLAREAAEDAEGLGDQRVSQVRPDNQIKPGNDVYLRVIDGDRDLSNDRDQIPVKMVADSGDRLQVMLTETGPHTGIFEAAAKTSELPAGALASDTAIEHSPLMAIDLDPDSMWLAEPDGASPKSLSIDMKDLKEVARVRMTSPDPKNNAPVRTTLRGSNDGEFWFRLASHPEVESAPAAVASFERMQQRIYNGRYTNYTKWYQVADLGKNREPSSTTEVDELAWQLDRDDDRAKQPHAVIWSGKLIQQRDGAARISVRGYTTALSLDGVLELPLKRGAQSADVWLARGAHDLTIFASIDAGSKGVEATIARADFSSDRISQESFRASDFDLSDPAAKINPIPAVIENPTAIDLPISSAKLNKKSDSFGMQATSDPPLLSHWTELEDTATWEFVVPEVGVYDVWLNVAHPGDGSQFVMEVGEGSIPCEVPDTEAWDRFRDTKVCTVVFDKAGKQTLTIHPTEIAAGGLMDLRSVQLRAATGASVIVRDKVWDFRFPPTKLRFTRMVFEEFLGESVAISNVEIGGVSADETYIPTKKDVLSLATNDSLEIAAGDTVTATYTDEFTQNGTGSSQLLTSRLSATYNNASVEPIVYEFARSGDGQVSETRLALKRIDAGDRLVVEITDYDEDRTNEQDTIEFEVSVNDAPPVKLTATETEAFTGVFTKEVDTAAKAKENADDEAPLVINPGDRVFIKYMDTENTFPGHAIPREAIVYVNQPTDAKISILESRVLPRDSEDLQPPQLRITAPPEDRSESLVALEAPITIEVIDPDRAKTSGSTVKVALVTTDGSAVIVECVVSGAFRTQTSSRRRGRTRNSTSDEALEMGRFVGQVIPQLGGRESPQLIPRSPRMPSRLLGNVLPVDQSDEEETSDLIARVINLTGKDTLTAAYNDKLRVGGKSEKLKAQGRLVSDGVLVITDREYKDPVEQLHVGEKIYFSVVDPDQDTSDERDEISLQVTTELGENETVQLGETLAHSGVFTGSFTLQASDQPKSGNFEEQPGIECYFGDRITATYIDPAASSIDETYIVKQDVPVVVGTNGLVSAFTKTFNDEKLAVETKFRIAESYFELFKSHKQLERSEEQKIDLEAGRRVLREVMEDYPDPKYAPRIAYLLGQFAQELEQWDEAIRSYEMIIRRYPDHTLAADARYKLAQSYEEAGDFDEALEAYVTLAATHPKSPLIASVMIRISDYFYKNDDFEIAAQVGEKFGERFEGHEHAPQMAFRVGQCYYKTEDFKSAGIAFDEFAKVFPDDDLSADSLFWSGEAYRFANNNSEAFRRYNRCRWDYPESEAATYARGRLALPEMLQQFEAEANSVDVD